ncbi:hypothetical protein UPYG_G00115970 [Umbra pygmaea]|uniref:Uncharacterized protein n=1 Tax=Umbra pygmaea TaxID=75934 RepID=A0ABD0XRD0_UMBPY
MSTSTTLLSTQPFHSLAGHAIDIRVMAASHRAMSEDVASEGSGDTIKGRGRVAQLMKTFSAKSPALPSQSPPRSNKPPLPTKPSHLRLAANPALR